MNITLNEQEIHTVYKALLQAQYEFNTCHNLIVTDLEQENDTAWHLDYSEASKLTDEAIAVLDKFGYSYTPDYHEHNA